MSDSTPTVTGGNVGNGGNPKYTFPPPRYTRETLDKVSGMYIVYNPSTNSYDYYYAKLGKEKTGNYVPIIRAPNFIPMGDGFMVFQRKLYKVTLRDFLRSRVNVGIGPYSVTATSTSADTSTPTQVGRRRGNQVTGQPITSEIIGSSEDSLADVAWQEQIDSLLYLEDSETEWDIVTDVT